MSSQQDVVIETPFMQKLINRSLLYINNGFPVHFTGPTGIGKSTLALTVADQLNRPVKFIRGHRDMSNEDLLGSMMGFERKKVEDNYIHSVYKEEVRTGPVWTSGQLVDAAKYGYTVIYDEFNRSTPEINNIFLYVLEEKILPLYGLYGASQPERFIRVHSDFRIMFISNPEDYTGAYAMQDALLDRMITIDMSEFDIDTYEQIVAQKANVGQSLAKNVTAIVYHILSKMSNIQNPSLRAGIMIATLAKNGEIRLGPDNSRFAGLCFDVLSRYVKKEQWPQLKTIIKQQLWNIIDDK